MERLEFERLVTEAIDELPDELHSRLENVAISVDDWPTKYQIGKAGLRQGMVLLGLYEGIPLTKRGTHYGMVTPDKITIFQKPIEAKCKNEVSMKNEIQRVVRHEIAHHFGIGEEHIREIERNSHKLRP
ncbi:MAG: metallopeptidase family protein [Dehalococcoidales bacterium]